MDPKRWLELLNQIGRGLLLPTWTKAGHAVYSLVCLALALVYDGPFIFSTRISGWDWGKETFYLGVLKSSLITYHTLPLSIVSGPGFDWYPAMGPTLSYWANPEVITLSPLLPLLFAVSTVVFIKLFFAAHLLAGVWGVWLLARRLGLPPCGAIVLFFVTALNPWMLQHVALGYTPHMTFLLCPAIIALLMGERECNRDIIVATALASLILYEGGLHISNWLFGTILLFSFIRTLQEPKLYLRRLWPLRLLPFFVGTALLSLPKLIGTAICYGRWQTGLLPTYRSASDLWGLLTDGNTALFKVPEGYDIYHTNFYDISVFVSAAFATIMVVALLRALFWTKDASRQRSLALAALALVVLGYGDVWARITNILPILRSEKYPARFLFPAVEITIALVIIQLHAWIDHRWRRTWSFLLLLPLLVAYHQRNRLCLAEATNSPAATAIAPGWPPQQLQAIVTTIDNQQLVQPIHLTASQILIAIPEKTWTVALRWARFHPYDTTVVGARTIKSNSGMVLMPLADAHQVVVRFNSFHAPQIAVASLAAYLLFFLALKRLRSHLLA